MTLSGPAQRLTVIISEDDIWHHSPVYTEIVHRAHRAGLAGASAFRGIEGFGAASRIHTARILSLSEDLPVAVVGIDIAENIGAFLPQLDALVTGGLIVLDDVRLHRYVGRRGAVTWLWVRLGAAVGAPARYLTDRVIQSRHATLYPWGTFAVNVAGSRILGVLLGAATHRPVPPPYGRRAGHRVLQGADQLTHLRL